MGIKEKDRFKEEAVFFFVHRAMNELRADSCFRKQPVQQVSIYFRTVAQPFSGLAGDINYLDLFSTDLARFSTILGKQPID